MTITRHISLIAHAGGIDELAFVLLPIVIFLTLQWLSRRKAKRNDEKP